MGRPNSVVLSDLSKTVCKVLQHIGVDTCEERIESRHCLNKEIDHTIVKFLGEKTEQVMGVKKDLKDLNPTDLDLSEGTRLFINDS